MHPRPNANRSCRLMSSAPIIHSKAMELTNRSLRSKLMKMFAVKQMRLSKCTDLRLSGKNHSHVRCVSLSISLDLLKSDRNHSCYMLDIETIRYFLNFETKNKSLTNSSRKMLFRGAYRAQLVILSTSAGEFHSP